MINTVNINLKTDIKTDKPTTLPITLMSQDKNNNQFILRFTNGGEAVALDDTYTVEVLTKFEKSGASRLTTAKVRQDYATWEFDTAYIAQDETVYNYVYVRKSGSLVVSADANCFVFSVDLSEIDKGAGKVAEVYDENYQKHLDEFKDNVDFEEIAQAEQARKEAETLREESYDQKVDLAIVEADVVDKVDNKVTELTPQISNLTAQLAQTVDKRPIYVADYGVSYLNTATGNTVAFKQALADAEVKSKPVILPWCPSDAFIEINDELVTTADYMNISGFGKNTRIKQLDNTKGIINAKGRHSYVGGASLFGTPFVKEGSGSSHTAHFGVRIESSHSVVENIYGDVLSTVVVAGRRPDDEQNVGSSVKNIESGHNVVFNLLVSHTKDFRYDNITGSYSDLAATPPHLIYVDNSSGFDHYNMQGGYCKAWDGTGSFAFQFKGMRGGNAGILHAEKCEGSYHLMDSSDFECREVVSIDDTWDKLTGQGSLTLDAVDKNERCSIDKVYITLDSGAKAVYFLATDDSVIKEMYVETNYNVRDGGVSDNVDIRGNRNKLINPKVVNKGVEKRFSSIAVARGEGNIIENPETSGNLYGIRIGDTNNGVNRIIEYDFEKQTNYGNNALIVQKATEVFQEKSVDRRKGLIAFDDALSTFDNTQHKFSSSGHEWITPNGRLNTLQNKGQIFTNSALSNGVVSSIDTSSTDIIFEGTLLYSDWDTIALKVIDYSNYLGIRLSHSDNRIHFISRVDGVTTNLNYESLSIIPGMVYDLKVIMKGNKIIMLVNGVQVISVEVSNELMTIFGTSTKYGIWGRGPEGGKWSGLKWSKM